MAIESVCTVIFLTIFCAAQQAACASLGDPSNPLAPTTFGQPCLSPDPTEQSRRKAIAATLYPHEEAFAIQSFNQTTPDTTSNALDMDHCPLDGVTSPESCQQGVSPTYPEKADSDSTCPFSYVTCYDPDRIPSKLSLAQCKCSSCIDPYSNLVDPNFSCRPVFHNMQVLRKKGCANGMFRYEMEEERIPVACACMRRAVVSFNNNHPF